MPDRMTFADAIRRVRTSAKMTQRELAAHAGISRTQLVRIEGGLKPGPQTRQRLIGALRFSNLNELFAAAGDREAKLRGQWLGAEKARAELVARREGALRAPSEARWRLLA